MKNKNFSCIYTQFNKRSNFVYAERLSRSLETNVNSGKSAEKDEYLDNPANIRNLMLMDEFEKNFKDRIKNNILVLRKIVNGCEYNYTFKLNPKKATLDITVVNESEKKSGKNVDPIVYNGITFMRLYSESSTVPGDQFRQVLEDSLKERDSLEKQNEKYRSYISKINNYMKRKDGGLDYLEKMIISGRIRTMLDFENVLKTLFSNAVCYSNEGKNVPYRLKNPSKGTLNFPINLNSVTYMISTKPDGTFAIKGTPNKNWDLAESIMSGLISKNKVKVMDIGKFSFLAELEKSKPLTEEQARRKMNAKLEQVLTKYEDMEPEMFMKNIKTEAALHKRVFLELYTFLKGLRLYDSVDSFVSNRIGESQLSINTGRGVVRFLPKVDLSYKWCEEVFSEKQKAFKGRKWMPLGFFSPFGIGSLSINWFTRDKSKSIRRDRRRKS